MRLTIFWRMILTQLTLIGLILGVSLYALTQLNRLASLSTDILATDSAGIETEKQLLKIFFTQMRNAEKYLLLRDQAYYGGFTQGGGDFEATIEKLAALTDTAYERSLLKQLRALHTRYAASLNTALSRTSNWNQEKTEIADAITAGINDLIRFREAEVARKTAVARDQAALAARTVGWLALGGIGTALLLTYWHARSVSRPLKKLAQGLRQVGHGEFCCTLAVRAPKEVSELAQAFNWMAARLAELDQMKTDFIAHVSHAFRTPLTGIQEGTALLLENIPEPITSAQREILEVVRSHSEQLFRSIATILDVAKIEAGMLEYLWAPTDLVALIDRGIRTVQLPAQKKQLQLGMTCPSPFPLLYLDGGRIQQVLDNLLSNAVKFTLPGGTIRVAAIPQEGKGEQEDWVEVRVVDTGMGIPAEDVERIFDRFYQSPYHRGQNKHGTGLGLAIAQHIVRAHGGEIWAESRVGEGSAFVFTLPINHSADAERPLLAAPDKGGKAMV